MIRRTPVGLIALALLLASHADAGSLDLSQPKDNLTAYLKMRASLDGKDTVTWWSGQVFAAVPDERPKLLFGFEGMNVARAEQQKDGSWRMYSREYAVYKDPQTGAILDEWANPYTGETVAVFHVQNDPVNFTLGQSAGAEPARLLPLRQVGADVILGLDLPLAYPNPITPEQHPRHSTGALYVGSEHFGFYARKADLDDTRQLSVPMQLAWFREAPWLPWMQMGDHAGLLIYSGYGKKLTGGVDELPAPLRQHIGKVAPEFLHAPRDWVQPNATSWTVYKRKVLDAQPAAAAAEPPVDD